MLAQTQKECDSLTQKGIDLMNAQNHVESIRLLKKVYTVSIKNNWYKQYFLATNNIGINYFRINDYSSAIKYYLQAYAAATKKNKPSDEMAVLNNIALLYVSEEKYQKAETYFLKVLLIARETKENSKIGYCLTNLGLLATDQNNTAKAKKYLIEAKSYLKKDKRAFLLANVCLLRVYLREKKYVLLTEKAKELLQEADQQNFLDQKSAIELILGEYYFEVSKFDLALKNLYSGLRKVQFLDDKIKAYKLIADIYEAKHDYKKASQYKDSTYIVSEKINEERNSQLYANNKMRFELLNLEKDLSIEKLSNNAKRKILVLVIISLFLLVVVLILLFKKRIERYKRLQKIKEIQLKKSQDEILKQNSNTILLEEKILQNEKNALQEQEKLKHEIEQRNLKITEKILLQTTKNELIQDLLKTLESRTQKSSDSTLMVAIESLKKYLAEDTKWEEYISLFEDVNPKFIKALKYRHTNLSADDIRFLSYIYLNFETKEISSLLNITPEGVRKRKERTLKKMNLTHNTHLFNYLITLE